ncbi:hypothetical protein ACFLUJ_08365 [Chloroflexota bacterium]
MSTTVQIGIGLFVLGIVGFFFIADKLFVELSGLWYSTIVAFLVIAIVGLALLWKEWGPRSRNNHKRRKNQ